MSNTALAQPPIRKGWLSTQSLPKVAERCAHETVGNMIAKTAIRRRSKVRFCIFMLLMVPDVKRIAATKM